MPRTENSRSASVALYLAAGATLAIIQLASGSVFAATVTDPFGNAGSTGYVNKDPSDNSHWINWKNKATGACSFTFLGNGGLSDNFNVEGSGGDDDLIVLSSSNNFSFCGFQMTGPNYNGHFLDLFGGDGGDGMFSDIGDTWLSGNAGDDRITSGNAAASIFGGAGNDSINNGAGGGSGGNTFGEDGNDCVNVNTLQTPASMSCGAGTDTWFGPGTRPADCESTSSACCPGFIC